MSASHKTVINRAVKLAPTTRIDNRNGRTW